MGYKLEKPYTDKERCDFIVEHIYTNGLIFQETETAIYALEKWEILENDQIKDNSEEYQAEQEEKEKEFINNLTMTPLDFIGVLQSFGLTLEQINAYLEANLPVKMQLTYCNSVYCGIAKSLMPITVDDITITADMVENAFKVKNGKITNESEVNNEETV